MFALELNSLDPTKLKSLLEALLFISGAPVSIEQMAGVLEPITPSSIRDALEQLTQEYEIAQRGLKIVEVAGGYQMVTQREWAAWLKRFLQQVPQRLSRQCLETLAIIAYRQPITRLEIEQIRGVNSESAIQTLLEKGMVRIMGRKEVIGRPFVYEVTGLFLERFGLASLNDLPRLEEVVNESGAVTQTN